MTDPTPAQLRSFEAAARLGSLTRAAAELGVTPGAVGHAVRALEAWAGTPLLMRDGRRLVPTESARRALPALGQGFAELSAAAAIMRVDAARQVTVAIDPSFAARWLVPQLEAIRRAIGAVDIRMVVPDFPDPLADPDVDLAILYRLPPDSGLRISALLTERVLPLCAPALKPRQASCADFPQGRHLLHVDIAQGDSDYPNWNGWFSLAGLDPAGARAGNRFSHAVMALQAAIDGQGVALAGDVMAAEALAAGHLVRSVDDPPALILQRHLVVRRKPEPRPQVRRVCRLLANAAAAGSLQ